jgi:hypothetical protein
MMVRSCSHVAQIHNIRVKIVNPFSENMKRISVKMRINFQQETYVLSVENSGWTHEKLLMIVTEKR